ASCPSATGGLGLATISWDREDKMKFTAEITFAAHSDLDAIAGPAIAQVALEAEQGGYDAISFNEHPAPSAKWLAAGGHDAYDPFVVLAYCAAHTKKIRLIPYL